MTKKLARFYSELSNILYLHCFLLMSNHVSDIMKFPVRPINSDNYWNMQASMIICSTILYKKPMRLKMGPFVFCSLGTGFWGFLTSKKVLPPYFFEKKLLTPFYSPKKVFTHFPSLIETKCIFSESLLPSFYYMCRVHFCMLTSSVWEKMNFFLFYLSLWLLDVMNITFVF